MNARRVGLMLPSSNTTMEPDLVRGLGDLASLHTARMYLADVTVASETEMLDAFAMLAARDLATLQPDLVVFGCTSAGALRGQTYDSDLCSRIGELTGAPTVSTIRSVREAIAARAPARLGVFTPYVDELNDRIRASLEDGGLPVARIAGLGLRGNLAIGHLGPERIVDEVGRAFAGSDVDLVFVSCTNLRATVAISELAGRLGVPVVTSNQAVTDAVRERLGVS